MDNVPGREAGGAQNRGKEKGREKEEKRKEEKRRKKERREKGRRTRKEKKKRKCGPVANWGGLEGGGGRPLPFQLSPTPTLRAPPPLLVLAVSLDSKLARISFTDLNVSTHFSHEKY